MNELALFAGVGGGILGGHLLGWRTVCAVEWEAYPASVLVARQNDKVLPPFPIWDDVQTFDGKPWRGIVDVVSGGFPCQDISAAGKGVGITGARSSMWGHMARIIGEVRPRYAFVENSPMLTTRGLGIVLRDLATLGYDAQWCVLGANDVGARHQRDRIWILAYTNSKPDAIDGGNRCISQIGGQWNIDNGRSRRNVNGIIEPTKNEEVDSRQQNIFSHSEHNRIGWGKQWSEGIEEKNGRHSIGELADTNLCGYLHGQTEIQSTGGKLDALGKFRSSSQNVANTSMSGFSSCNQSAFRSEQQILERQSWGSCNEYGTKDYWEIEPSVGRVVDGMAARVDRLKAIGNGQVPLCAATAWNILKGRIDD
jgi:DNA (cytosine-5)-methyltransferase 1